MNRAVPALRPAPSGATGDRVLLGAYGLRTWFPLQGGILRRTVGHVKAVTDVDLEVEAGTIEALVGESGCGKSTLGQSVLGLVPVTAGRVFLGGEEMDIRRPASWTPHRRHFQIIFQDPYSSLNPRHTVFEILSEPLLAHGLVRRAEARDAVAELLRKVGLSPDYMGRFPHAFSGGQRQRLGIARAIGLRPRLIVCDEVVAALDVSVQAQIIRLLLDLKAEMGLSLLFISHDLSLVEAISDRVNVMYLGRIVERADPKTLFRQPRHPYTRALLDSIPTLDRSRRPRPLSGEVPSPVRLPQGCAFAPRCPRAQADCREEVPPLFALPPSEAACYHPLD